MLIWTNVSGLENRVLATVGPKLQLPDQPPPKITAAHRLPNPRSRVRESHFQSWASPLDKM